MVTKKLRRKARIKRLIKKTNQEDVLKIEIPRIAIAMFFGVFIGAFFVVMVYEAKDFRENRASVEQGSFEKSFDCSLYAYTFESKEIAEQYFKENNYSTSKYLGKTNNPTHYSYWVSFCWNDPLGYIEKIGVVS